MRVAAQHQSSGWLSPLTMQTMHRTWHKPSHDPCLKREGRRESSLPPHIPGRPLEGRLSRCSRSGRRRLRARPGARCCTARCRRRHSRSAAERPAWRPATGTAAVPRRRARASRTPLQLATPTASHPRIWSVARHDVMGRQPRGGPSGLCSFGRSWDGNVWQHAWQHACTPIMRHAN